MVGTTKALELAELSEFSNSLTHRFCSPGQLTFWVMIQNLGKVYQCHAHMESYSETGRQKTSTVLFLPPCSNAHVQCVTDAGKKNATDSAQYAAICILFISVVSKKGNERRTGRDKFSAIG